jgi:hypothetical protein
MTTEQLVAALEKAGPILWEPGYEGRRGWAICPCCGKRELQVVISDEEENDDE